MSFFGKKSIIKFDTEKLAPGMLISVYWTIPTTKRYTDPEHREVSGVVTEVTETKVKYFSVAGEGEINFTELKENKGEFTVEFSPRIGDRGF